MKVSCVRELNGLKIYLAGELDHHAARQVVFEIAEKIDETLPPTCVLDLGSISFMDSSGIAVILGAYRRMKGLGGSLSVQNTPPQSKKVLFAAGVDRLVDIN